MDSLVSSRNGYKKFKELPNSYVPDWKILKIESIPPPDIEETSNKKEEEDKPVEVLRVENQEQHTDVSNEDPLLGIRILTLTYLAHVLIFTYAAFSKGRWD